MNHKNHRCPQCNSKLKMNDSEALSLRGLDFEERTMVEQSGLVYYMCERCPCFFLFLKTKIFTWVYDDDLRDFIWKEINKEKVTFT